MGYDFIEVAQAGHVTRITLNRPEVLNAINQGMHDELQAAFDRFAADDEQWLCVVAGAGERAFSAGSDLKSIARSGQAHVYPRCGYAGLIERFDLDKPLTVVINGKMRYEAVPKEHPAYVLTEAWRDGGIPRYRAQLVLVP